MPVSEAKKKANARWNASKDNIMLRPTKEEGAAIRAAAAAAGQSNQQYILQATRERMARDGARGPQEPAEDPLTAFLAQGESVNGVINRAIDHQISQDHDKGPSEAQQGPPVAIQEALQMAQKAAQKAGETVSQFVERAVDAQAQRDEASLKLGMNPSTGGKLEKEEA